VIKQHDLMRTTEVLPAKGKQHVWWMLAFACGGIGFVIHPFDFLFSMPNRPAWMPGDLIRIVILSEIFAHGFGVVLIVFGIWQLVSEKRRYLPRLIACATLPGLVVQVLKLTISRDRPLKFWKSATEMTFPKSVNDTWKGWLVDGEMNVEYLSQSFPSAHAATACGLAIGLSWIFPKGRALFFLIAVLASLQRVVSLSHWSSDVCFGAAIAILVAGSLTQNWGLGYWLGRWEERMGRTTSRTRRAL